MKKKPSTKPKAPQKPDKAKGETQSAEIPASRSRGKKTSGARRGAKQYQTERRIPSEEEHWQKLTESATIWIWQTDESIRHIYSNSFVKEYLGYEPEEFLTFDILDLVHPDDHSVTQELIRKAKMNTSGWSNQVLRWRHKDGSWRYIESNGWPLLDDRGNFAGLRGVDRDVTDRKKIEQELLESERKYRDLFELSTDAIFILDLKGNFIDVNKTAHTRLGYTKEEMLSLHISQLDPPEFATKVPERLALINRLGMAVFESAHIRKDGSIMPVEVNSRLLDYGGQNVYFSVIRDITERKQAEEEISERRALLQQILDTSSVAIFLVDNTGSITLANTRMTEMFGWTMEELIGKNYVDLVHPSERDIGRQKMHALLASEIQSVDLERHYWRKDGTEFWGRLTGKRFYDVHGNKLGLVGVISDITVRKQAEQALKENQSFLETIIEAAPT